MKKDYRLLLMGTFDSVFIANFVLHLKRTNPQVHIYYYGSKNEFQFDENQKALDFLDDYYLYSDNSIFRKIPKLSMLSFIYTWRKHFRKYIANRKFDIVCINFVRYSHALVLDYIKSCSSKLVLAPWGSDVFRVTKVERMMQQRLYNNADYVKGPKGKFTDLVQLQYGVPVNKFVSLHLGSSLIDYILENKTAVSCYQAKKLLNMEGKYLVTCGYNASSTQNHLSIINAIDKVKDSLPKNMVLLFPLTYGRNEVYINTIKNRIIELGLNACYFEKFLDIPHLFLLRQATDLFIHVQSSDAFSASIREYLLCDKKVINGKWLRYNDLEEDGMIPYFVAEDLSSLSETLLYAYHSNLLPISTKAYETIVSMGWSAINDWDNFFSKIS